MEKAFNFTSTACPPTEQWEIRQMATSVHFWGKSNQNIEHLAHLYHLTLSAETHCGNCLCPCVFVSQGCHPKVPLTGLKQQKRIVSQFWQLDAQDQCVSRVGSFWGLWGWICPTPFSSLLVVWRQSLVFPWLIGASPGSPPSSSSGVLLPVSLHIVFPLHRSMSKFPLFVRTPVILD